MVCAPVHNVRPSDLSERNPSKESMASAPISIAMALVILGLEL